MIKLVYKRVYTIVLMSALFLNSGCTRIFDQTDGYLAGVIHIGPICPVEKDPPDPGCLPTAETYKAYPVSVYTSDGRRRIRQIDPLLDGSYNIELPAGKYLVILDKGNYGPGSSNLPQKIIIMQNDTTFLDVDIDTGIR
jgi:hypothetical protein